MRASSVAALAGLIALLFAPLAGAQSSDLGARMDRIAAEKSREPQAQRTQQTDDFSATLEEMRGERRNVVGLLAEKDACPAWTDNAVSACDCASHGLPDRNAKIVWRSACGVMDLDLYSGTPFGHVPQLDCARRAEFEQQVARQVRGSGASGSLSYAGQAWERWAGSTGCKGDPVPAQAPEAGSADHASAMCTGDDFPLPNADLPPKRGEILCSDGTRKSFTVEVRKGFVFRIKNSAGSTHIYNASRNRDPVSGAYLLDSEFLAAAVCFVQSDPSTVQQFTRWFKSWVEIENPMSAIFRDTRPLATCGGVRG